MGKPKAVNYRIIDPIKESEPHELLDAVRTKHHEELEGATIGLAWRRRWQWRNRGCAGRLSCFRRGPRRGGRGLFFGLV